MITRHRGHIAATPLLAAFALLLFARLLFTDRVLANGDILHYFYPYRDYAAAALRDGRIPLWNPYIFGGAPFLANPQAAVLYPLHWPLSWLPVTKQIYWSAAIHTWILALGGYALMRRLGAGWAAGMVTGLVLAGSGFYGGLIGHINQMNGAAWLPWLVWTVMERQKAKGGRQKERVRETGAMPDPQFAIRNSQFAIRICLFALFVSLSLLAGHTQTAYINLFGVGVMIVGLGIWDRRQTTDGGRWLAQSPIPNPQSLFPTLLVYAAGSALALLLSAAQLLPTLELSGLGLRGGGLSYQEVTSFSLRPLLLPWTLLPSYGLRDLGVVFGTLGYTEFVASVGTIGLLLAGAGLWRGRGNRLWWMGVGFAALGLLLALGRWNPVYYLLYKVVPGFDLFRTPARWMMLYTLGVALLAGAGIGSWGSGTGDRGGDASPSPQSPVPDRRVPRRIILLGILALDLILSARALPHTQPTAPQAVYDVRTAPAHLLTDPERSLHPAAMGRFLSMSTITFDPGDMADWRRIFRGSEPPQLDETAFGEFVIALKAQEILAPNLPLLWRIPAADGFDGGVLPLDRYNRFLALFIPPEQLVPDGRLREQVKHIPPATLLDLMDIRYVITDKVEDLWFEGVYYDRQIGARLGADGVTEITTAVDRPFQATEVRIVGALAGTADALAPLADSVRPLVAVQSVVDDNIISLPPLTGGGGAGAHFADDRLDSPLALASSAQVAFRDVEGGRQEYLARLPLPQPTTPDALHLSLLPGTPQGVAVIVQAITLFDERAGTFVPLLPSDQGDFRLAHSGDVKIYQRLAGPGRVALVTSAQAAQDEDVALAQLLAAAGGQTVVEADPATIAAWGLTGGAAGTAHLRSYAPERMVIETESDAPALLVLRDAFYPGWRATIDGAPAPIYPVDVLFPRRGSARGPAPNRLCLRSTLLALGAGAERSGDCALAFAFGVGLVTPGCRACGIIVKRVSSEQQ
jgi:hypothetical protein